MIPRTLAPILLRLARGFPVITLTGPRQSGKTTLCRATFPELTYVSLEAPDVRQYARQDPRGFLADLAGGAILDEIQRAPELTSYLQVMVDEDPTPGRFVITGSEHLAVTQATAQSLAGRTAVAHLLPFDRQELRAAGHGDDDLMATLWRGGYPALFDRPVTPGDWLSAYSAMYLERDVRQLVNVGDLDAFRTFMGLCAGRVGQIVNLSALGGDAGVSHNTARAWMSVLQASYLTFQLRPWHRNLGKRLIRRPRLYFWDTGLLCHLLGVRSPDELTRHPLRGPIFENMVVAELARAAWHKGQTPRLTFYRDQRGLEVDVVAEQSGELIAIETKSGKTIGGDFFAGLAAFRALFEATGSSTTLRTVLVYGGEDGQNRSAGQVMSWREVDQILTG